MEQICVILILMIKAMTCYPINEVNSKHKPELKDELHFPNGTVIGKYTYMDNDGNPVEVKYYAGDSSYGVELNSIKLLKSNSEEPPWMSDKLQTTEPAFKDVSNLLNFNPAFGNKYKIDPYNYLNKEHMKTHYKVDKPNPDYEIFYKNELKFPKQCTKDKVRVYLDNKGKRKVRDSLNIDSVSKDCHQY